MNIEDKIFPGNGELIIAEDLTTAVIIDAEIDPINCTFCNDGCVDLDTTNLTYVKLSVDNLYEMIDLIEKSEDHFADL